MEVFLGSVHFGGVTSGGVGIHNAAKIMVEGDGTWASNDYPTRMAFFTTADGASSPTEKMRINSDGKVGIGCTPGYDFEVRTNDTSTEPQQVIRQIGTGDAALGFQIPSANNWYLGVDNSDSDTFKIGSGLTVGTTPHLNINSSGQVLIAHTSAVGSHNEKFGIDCDQASGFGIFVSGDSSTGGSTNITAMRFYDSGSSAGVVGSIIFNDTATAFNTSSDYRLKENVTYSWDATTRLKQLKPARFNFIKNKDKTMDGFLAHEVSSIVPEAITGEKDGAEMQGIDQSKLVPLLVKTIQELEARITTLEG